MRKLGLYFLIQIILGSSLFAQEKTYGGSEMTREDRRSGLGSLVIIPFEDRMYMSDADGPIGRETGLDPGELQIKFRNALLESLEQELSKDWNLSVLFEDERRAEGFDLAFIHSSRRYDYTAISDEVLMKDDTTLTKKELKAARKGSGGKSGIEGGQIVTASDNSPKYMNLRISNDTLIQYLNHTSASDYYLFVNEFDIRHYVSDPDKIASGGLSYQLKVHFSCLDGKGKSVVSGAATSLVDAGTQNIYDIIVAGIPELTEKMARMIRNSSGNQR